MTEQQVFILADQALCDVVARGLRVHGIARFIGADTTTPPELVGGLWDVLLPQAEEWRSLGVHGPAVPVPGDAPLQDRLLGLTGGQPR